MRRRKTESITNLSHDVISHIDPKGRRYESQAVQVWPEVAGSEIARHTRGFAMREGQLVVFVDSAAWANELSLMSEKLKEGINSRVGRDLVKSMRFSVSKKVQEEARWEFARQEDEAFYEPDDDKPIPLSESELGQARYIAEAVRDPELRETALRVMIKDLERKKGVRAANEAQGATQGSKGTDSSS